MPQICKVRIVNFYFNDGKRLIADELFRFDKPDTGEALNTLLSLVNGGGKSVIVQLMMQPVVPRAILAGRKIESFFCKASDHCFILLEWKLDDSYNKLLTGIAISAVETAKEDGRDDNEKSQRGYQAKYYTFIHQYKNFGDKNDIKNMVLSQKTNNIFTAASFETVRESLKSQKIDCFGMDKQKIYKERLDEFGISKTEWENVICEINKTEGGIDKFFSDYKSGDALLDKLLIATIDRKMAVSNNEYDDNSLKTMLLNYSKRYISRAADVRLRDDIILFSEKLTSLKPDAEKLWKITDDLRMQISVLHNFHFTLNNEKNRLDTETAELLKKILEIKKEIGHIKSEELSEKYYTQKAESDALSAVLNECMKELNEDTAELKTVIYEIAVQKAADLNAQLCDYKAKLKALTEQIAEKENDSNNRGYITSLKYSIWQNSIQTTEKVTNEYGNMIVKHTDIVNQLKTVQKQSSEYEAAVSRLNNKIQSNRGILSEKKENLTKILQKLSLDITPALDEHYKESDIINSEKYLAKKISDAKETENNITVYIENIKGKISALYDLKTDRNEKCLAAKNKLNQLKSEIDNYSVKEDHVRFVLQRYNIDYKERFSKYPSQFLKSRINETTAELNTTGRQLEALTEQRHAAENGVLHLNKVVLSYINNLGIEYEPGEKYLLYHPQLLAVCPTIAYGIITNSSDRELLFDAGRAEWLPSVLPVYTYDDIDKILSGQLNDGSVFLSCYAENYFTDKDTFIKSINADINRLMDKSELKKAVLLQLSDDMNIIDSFDYAVDYFDNLSGTLNNTENDLRQINKAIAAADDEIRESESSVKQAEIKIKSQQAEIIKSENALNEFIGWKKQLALYYSFSDETDKLHGEYRDAANSSRLLLKQVSEYTKAETELNSEIEVCKEKLKMTKHVTEQFKDTLAAPVIGGELTDLLSEYNKYQETISGSINLLKSQRNEYIQLSDKTAAGIDEYGIPEDEYSSVVYSKIKVSQLQKRRTELESLIQDLSDDKLKTERKFDRSQMQCDNYLNDIKKLSYEFLSKAQIGKDFEKRVIIKNTELADTEEKRISADRRISELQAQIFLISRDIKKHTNSKTLSEIKLMNNISEQYSDMNERLDNLISQLKSSQEMYVSELKHTKTDFANKYDGFLATLDGLISLVNDTGTDHDRYFTVIERMNADSETYSKLTSQINTDLADIDNSRKDIIIQCLHHGRRMYDELKKLSDSSRIKLPGQKSYKAMLIFHLADDIDDNIAMERIGSEIDASVLQICSIYAEQKNDTDIEKLAEKAIRSRNLLNSYIGTDDIYIDVYKIDVNNQNCTYRRWDTAITNNSGGEKFVIFFSVMLAIMSYSRSAGLSDNRNLSSVLIMDNPFGPISSEHLLIPMFIIAKHFKVQLICLSDISKTDITKCFDVVCKLKIKQLQLGNTEMLQCESNERIEHAFYRTEQLSFWE